MAKGVKEPNYAQEEELSDLQSFKDSIAECFQQLEDPRRVCVVSYKLPDLIAILVCAVIAGANGVCAVVEYARAKAAWLSTWLDLDGQVPCYHTFWWLLTRLKPEALEEGFRQWVMLARKRGLSSHLGHVIALDGKTLIGAASRNSNDPLIHLVSAWDSCQGLILGQQKTEDKSNEITALPKLLEDLDIQGSIITIDAMGCQKEIAKRVLEGGGDYVIALKGNQPHLLDEAKNFFCQALELTPELSGSKVSSCMNKAHGRLEKREVWAVEDLEWLPQKGSWSGLRSLVAVMSTRQSQGKVEKETRYYISSLPADPSLLGRAIRYHWGIENKVHWVLDVVFREDESQLSRHAGVNFSLLRRLTMNILRLSTDTKTSLIGRRRKAGWNNDYMAQLLGMMPVKNL